MSTIVKGWNNSRHQMPPDASLVWVTGEPNAEVYAAVFFKGERIDQGVECFYWNVTGFGNISHAHWFWQLREAAPEPMKPEVRGGIHEANKAVWVYSANKTPFEFNTPFWIYDERLGVRLATLIRLEYGGDTHGFPVFLDWESGDLLHGRRYYMPLLLPTKPV